MTGKEAGEITMHSLQVGQKQNLIPVWAINTFVCFELKQRSIYNLHLEQEKTFFCSSVRLFDNSVWRDGPFLAGGPKAFVKRSNFKGILLLIYTQRIPVHARWGYNKICVMFCLMEFVRPANTNKWTKEIKERMYEWKMQTLKIC